MTVLLAPDTDLEIELGMVIEKHKGQGLDIIIEALDFYVVQLEMQRDDQKSLSSSLVPSSSAKKN